MTSRALRLAPFLFVMMFSSRVRAQAGGFVVTLGADTVQIERFTMRGGRLEGTVLTHAPQARVIKYSLTLAPDSTPLRYEYATFLPDGTPLKANGQAGSIVFASDTLTRETLRDGQMITERVASRPGILPGPTLPYIGMTVMMYELGFRYARKTANETGASGIPQVFMSPGFVQPSRTPIWFIGSDSVEMDYFGVARRGFKLDAQGRIMRADWSGSTYKYQMARIPDADVEAIAKAWAIKDRAGTGMGVMSPIDTLRANVGAASIMVTYSRPAMRGRTIWGSLVPWNQVWRFGADYATHFSTSVDMTLGATVLPAGRYTLWMLPSERGESMLIVNKQVNIFGTNYNPANDFARIPLRRASLASPVERFTIAVDANAGLCARWDATEWCVPLAVRMP